MGGGRVTVGTEQALPGGTCARDGCAAPAGGACARGLADPVDCDDFEPAEADDDELADERRTQERDHGQDLDVRGRQPWQPSGTGEPLYSGEALTAEEATALLRDNGAALAVPIGTVGVGKTTLLAALYETLAAGSVAGWSFAGSLSLMGFEARSFLATRSSGRRSPDTPRTTVGTGQTLLHLALRSQGRELSNVLLADVSGEQADAFRRLGDPGDYAPLLRSATCALVLVDGERLSEPRSAHAAVTEARTAARAVLESGLLRAFVPLHVVATKWDLCATSTESAERASSALDGLTDDIASRGGMALRFRIASRSAPGAPTGDGFDALLPHLLRVLPARRPAPVEPWPASGTARSFDAASAVATRFLGARA